MNDENGGKEEKRKWGGLIAFARLSGRTSKKKNRLSPFFCVLWQATHSPTQRLPFLPHISYHTDERKRKISL